MYPQPELEDLIDPARLTPRERIAVAVRDHPHKTVAAIETALWAIVLYSTLDHVVNTDGLTSYIVWLFTIGPHEIGHLICTPFGWLLMMLGGSIWQILFWVLLGLYGWFIRRQRAAALLMAALVGHSFINLARYVGDAQERSMPLLFGMSADHHDWWNILGALNLRPLDDALAIMTLATGIVLIIAACVGGLALTWRIWRPDLRPL